MPFFRTDNNKPYLNAPLSKSLPPPVHEDLSAGSSSAGSVRQSHGSQSHRFLLTHGLTQDIEAFAKKPDMPPDMTPDMTNISCVMGAAGLLGLGFYGSPWRLPVPHAVSVGPERLPLRPPPRGKINRLLSRFHFKSEDTQLGNFHQVDSLILRGAMPESADDFIRLRQRYGVSAIIDLRGWETTQPAYIDYERSQAHQNGMRYVHVPMHSYLPPNQKQMQTVFRVIEQTRQQGGKVYIHCKQGVDRTGVVVAAYQVAGGQSQAKAYEGMRCYGYNWLHRLTRPAQKAFILDQRLPAFLEKARQGARIQSQG